MASRRRGELAGPTAPPPETLELRQAGREGAGAMAAVETACFPSSPWTEEALAAAVGQPATCGLLARVAGQVVGYALYRVVLDEAELLRLAVAPGSRRRGTARALLGRGDALLRARGCAAAFLEVRADNLPAIRLYEDAGWHRVGSRPGYYPDGMAAVLYRREL
jgi:[ribosomal protein S18]-alanine N-acetyltransferase